MNENLFTISGTVSTICLISNCFYICVMHQKLEYMKNFVFVGLIISLEYEFQYSGALLFCMAESREHD